MSNHNSFRVLFDKIATDNSSLKIILYFCLGNDQLLDKQVTTALTLFAPNEHVKKLSQARQHLSHKPRYAPHRVLSRYYLKGRRKYGVNWIG